MNKDDKIIDQAKDRFKFCEEYESATRVNFQSDIKFCNGDSQNLFQWPDVLSRDRISQNRPCLTINKTRQYVLNIVNDQRQNQSQISVRPTGGGATFDSAKIFEGVIRYIENISNAQQAYSNANYSQVIGGWGYWRVITDWEHTDSFEQEIFIRRVADPLSIYLDPDISEADGSDARFAFVFRDMPIDEYQAAYPKEDEYNSSPFGEGSDWRDEDHVRVCEYYRIIDEKDTLYELPDGSIVKESEVKKLNPEILDHLKLMATRSRKIDVAKVEWYLIAGSEIIDRKIWPGKYIPIVRVVGEENVIDKTLDRKGHVRHLRDSQQMLNYFASSAVEFVALQSKTPYLATSEAIEGYEDLWASANTDNHSVLLYNAIGTNGEPTEKPIRQEPPQMAPAYLQGVQMAKDHMMHESGQFEASMGQKSNEISGKAVDARQRQGEQSTYHYIDRFSHSIRFTGRILVDLIPKIYDTERVIKILAIDGTQSTVKLDPKHPEAAQDVQDKDSEDFDPQEVAAIFNPNVGKYSVECDIGPAYASRRQESFNAMTQIIQHNANLMPIIGDLMFKSADFPLADEIADRLHNMVSPQALGTDKDKQPDPQLAQMQQHLAQQHDLLTQMQKKLADAEQKVKDNSSKHTLDEYNAETQRMAVVGKIDPNAMRPIIRQLVSEVLGTNANPIIAQHAKEAAEMWNPEAMPIDQQMQNQMPPQQDPNQDPEQV